MRGKDEMGDSLFSYVDLERQIRPDHPLRTIWGNVNAALAEMSAEFGAPVTRRWWYSQSGCASAGPSASGAGAAPSPAPPRGMAAASLTARAW